jgi:dipicolinate synthase subunit A
VVVPQRGGLFLIYTVVGGDERQIRLTRLLLQDGHKVYTWGIGQNSLKSIEEAVAKAECVIWPLPLLTKAGMLNVADGSYLPDVVTDSMRNDQIGIGGRIPPWLIEQASENGLTLVDYVKREDFAIANAVPSAEGAVQLAMEQTEHTIHGSDCLIIGFGRIGKVLARMMSCLGANVTVSARKTEDFCWSDAFGYKTADTRDLENVLNSFDIVFNTVPHMVLTDARLARVKPGALIVDLASNPGGVDFEAAKKRGINCRWALALPGRVAPESAAAILRDTIYQIIKEGAVT